MKNKVVILSFILFLLSSYSFAQNPTQEAFFYEKLNNNNLQCKLCPRECVILPKKRGFCQVRENREGKLLALSYGNLVSINIDPVEKKPFFHFYPSTKVFSIASAGCNLKCKFCQNWQISQTCTEKVENIYLKPEELIKKIKESGTNIIAYTYTEPTIFYEYMLEVAKLSKENGIKNTIHSNGFINEKPLRELAKYLDAANIDLKGFSDEYYKKLTEGSLAPVLRSLKILKDASVHLEITNLILPGYNDDLEQIKKMCLWIKTNLGENTPLHFSRFHPMYQMIALNPTPVLTLENARKIALECGLKYVYIGNVVGNLAENTYCPRCKKIVIKRVGYIVDEINLANGKCKFCGEIINGIW